MKYFVFILQTIMLISSCQKHPFEGFERKEPRNGFSVFEGAEGAQLFEFCDSSFLILNPEGKPLLIKTDKNLNEISSFTPTKGQQIKTGLITFKGDIILGGMREHSNNKTQAILMKIDNNLENESTKLVIGSGANLNRISSIVQGIDEYLYFSGEYSTGTFEYSSTFYGGTDDSLLTANIDQLFVDRFPKSRLKINNMNLLLYQFGNDLNGGNNFLTIKINDGGGSNLFNLYQTRPHDDFYLKRFIKPSYETPFALLGMKDDGKLYIRKTDDLMNVSKEVYIPDVNTDFVDIYQTRDSGYVVYGTTQIQGCPSLEGSNVILIRLDKNLNQIWRKIRGTNSNDKAFEIIQTCDGDFLYSWKMGTSEIIIERTPDKPDKH